MLQSELARTVIASIEARPSGVPFAEAELELIRFADEAPFDIRADFAKRFEDAVNYLQSSGASDQRSSRQGVICLMRLCILTQLGSYVGY